MRISVARITRGSIPGYEIDPAMRDLFTTEQTVLSK